MACEDAIMAQEEAILAALGEVASYAMVDGQLTLLDAAGVTVLALTPQVAPALTDVVWQGSELQQRQGSGRRPPRRVGNHRHLCRGRQPVWLRRLQQLHHQLYRGWQQPHDWHGGRHHDVLRRTRRRDGAGNRVPGRPRDGRDLFHQRGDARTAHGGRRAGGALSGGDRLGRGWPGSRGSVDPDPVAEDAEAAPVAFAAAATTVPSGRVTATLGVNVRVGPGTQYPIVGIAPLDTEGEIIGKSADGQWWAAQVPSAPNEQGWVAAAYVAATDAENVPVLPAPPLPEVTAAIQEGKPYAVPQNVILFSASRVAAEGNRAYDLEDIYAVQATPGAQAEMVANNALQPALSPDRTTLAFYSQQSDKLGVGGYDVNTGRRLRFSRFIEDSQPRWSPTGDRIVFASNRQGDRRWRIYITPAVDQENPSNMDYTELDFGKDPDWHPSQELLILKGCDAQGQNCGLYTMGTDGTNRTQFTDVASDSMPRWLPTAAPWSS